jgi:heme-degrading monooxygenase HmoA
VITEQALLDVRPGRESEFEDAFAKARTIIAAAPGFQSLELHRGIESPSRYLMIIRWERLEDHTEGFRKSTGYGEWKRLLHHFYDPFPTVEHFSLVAHA